MKCKAITQSNKKNEYLLVDELKWQNETCISGPREYINCCIWNLINGYLDVRSKTHTKSLEMLLYCFSK